MYCLLLAIANTPRSCVQCWLRLFLLKYNKLSSFQMQSFLQNKKIFNLCGGLSSEIFDFLFFGLLMAKKLSNFVKITQILHFLALKRPNENPLRKHFTNLAFILCKLEAYVLLMHMLWRKMALFPPEYS